MTTAAALQGADPSPEAVARVLAPGLEARAAEIEAARRLPADLSDTLARAGVYRWFVPARYGGLDASLPEAMRAIELLAHADASVAWCTFIAITSSTVLGFVPEPVAREVFATPETLVAGVFHPMGRADAAPGGFRVSGQWSFASGAWNAQWLCAGCQFFDGDERLRGPGGLPRTNMVLVPASEAELVDTWDVSGLAGTGSIDFRLHQAFVPTERVVGWTPRPTLAHPLYAFPQMTLLATGFGPIALGLARAALDELEALAHGQAARRELAPPRRARRRAGRGRARRGRLGVCARLPPRGPGSRLGHGLRRRSGAARAAARRAPGLAPRRRHRRARRRRGAPPRRRERARLGARSSRACSATSMA